VFLTITMGKCLKKFVNNDDVDNNIMLCVLKESQGGYKINACLAYTLLLLRIFHCKVNLLANFV